MRAWMAVVVVTGLGACGGVDRPDPDDDPIEDPVDAPCTVPAGTYTRETIRYGGDCNDVPIPTRDIDIPAGRACGVIVLADTTTEDTCTVKQTTTFTVTKDGIEDGKHRVDVACSGGQACVALFNVYFTKR